MDSENLHRGLGDSVLVLDLVAIEAFIWETLGGIFCIAETRQMF